MNAVPLNDADFKRMVALDARAQAMGFKVQRPQYEGDPFTILRKGEAVYDAADLDAMADWLA